MKDAKRAFIFISAANPGGSYKEIKGIDEILLRLENWRQFQKFESFTKYIFDNAEGNDTSSPSKLRNIIQEIHRLAKPESNLDQLIVYFVGHGISPNWEQRWVISERDGDKCAVNVSRTADNLELSPLKNVVIVSDCCRTIKSPPYYCGEEIAEPIALYSQYYRESNCLIEKIFSTGVTESAWALPIASETSIPIYSNFLTESLVNCDTSLIDEESNSILTFKLHQDTSKKVIEHTTRTRHYQTPPDILRSPWHFSSPARNSVANEESRSTAIPTGTTGLGVEMGNTISTGRIARIAERDCELGSTAPTNKAIPLAVDLNRLEKWSRYLSLVSPLQADLSLYESAHVAIYNLVEFNSKIDVKIKRREESFECQIVVANQAGLILESDNNYTVCVLLNGASVSAIWFRPKSGMNHASKFLTSVALSAVNVYEFPFDDAISEALRTGKFRGQEVDSPTFYLRAIHACRIWKGGPESRLLIKFAFANNRIMEQRCKTILHGSRMWFSGKDAGASSKNLPIERRDWLYRNWSDKNDIEKLMIDSSWAVYKASGIAAIEAQLKMNTADYWERVKCSGKLYLCTGEHSKVSLEVF